MMPQSAIMMPESAIMMPESAITMDWNWRSHSNGMRDHNRPDYAIRAVSCPRTSSVETRNDCADFARKLQRPCKPTLNQPKAQLSRCGDCEDQTARDAEGCTNSDVVPIGLEEMKGVAPCGVDAGLEHQEEAVLPKQARSRRGW
jgi:hypothetical protein